MSTYSVVIWKLIGDNEIPADAPIVEIIRTDELIPKKSDDGKNHVSMGYKGALWHGVIDSQHGVYNITYFRKQFSIHLKHLCHY